MTERQKTASALVVEDPLIRAFVRTYLSRHGFEVLEADLAGARDILGPSRPPVNVLITNQPAELADVASDLPLLYIAAFPDPAKAVRFRRVRMLSKPFRPEHLLAMLQELLAGAVGAG